MSRESENHPRNSLEELLKQSQLARPSDAFRDSLREKFLSGEFADDAEAPTLDTPIKRIEPSWLASRRLPLIRLAAALFIMALTLQFLGGRTSFQPWTLVSATGPGALISQGESLSAEGLARKLQSAETQELIPVKTEGEYEVVLRLADQMVWTLTPSTELLLRRDGRAARIIAGEVRVTTGDGFDGTRLRIDSEEARILVTGTTFAAIRNEDGTCLCVFEGQVKIAAVQGLGDDDGLRAIDAGLRTVIWKDGSEPKTEPLSGMEAMKLEMHRDASKSLLESDSDQ